MSDYHAPKLTRFDFDALDFLGGVAAMTAEEVGQYVLLLVQAWIAGRDCTLPDDPAGLARIARAACGEVSRRVLEKFDKTPEGRVVNHRLLQEWQAAKARSEVAQARAEKRWRGDAQAMPEHCQGSNETMPISIPTSVPTSGSVEVVGRLEGRAAPPQIRPAPSGQSQPPHPGPAPSSSGEPPASPTCSCPDLHAQPCSCRVRPPVAGPEPPTPDELRLCAHMASLLPEAKRAGWPALARKILALGAGDAATLCDIATAGVADAFWTTQLTGMGRFLSLLESDSERSLLSWYHARKRKAEAQAAPAKTAYTRRF
jgi:uncharacterized protein YdaU (DUF1376 family)